MWVVWVVAALSAGVVATCVILLRSAFRGAPRGWQILAASGVPLALGGLTFVVRFWEPLPGPYLANQRYPLGPYLNAWFLARLPHGIIGIGFALTGRAAWHSRGA